MTSEERQKLADLTDAAIAEAKPDLSAAPIENLKDANAETVSDKARDEGGYMLIGRLIRMVRLKRSGIVKASEDSARFAKVMGVGGVLSLLCTVGFLSMPPSLKRLLKFDCLQNALAFYWVNAALLFATQSERICPTFPPRAATLPKTGLCLV